MPESLFEKTKDKISKLPVKDQIEYFKEVKELVHASVISEQKKKEEEASQLQEIADRIANQK